MEKQQLDNLIYTYRQGGRGTGKTKAMLDQAWRWANEGKDVVVVSESDASSKALRHIFHNRYEVLADKSNKFVFPSFVASDSLPGADTRGIQRTVLVDPDVWVRLLQGAVSQPPKNELSESNITTLRLAVKEGLEEITKLETRLYPRNPEAFHLRTCFYAVKSVLDSLEEKEPKAPPCPHCGLAILWYGSPVHKADCQIIKDLRDKKEELHPRATENLFSGHIGSFKGPVTFDFAEKGDLSKLTPVGWYSVHTKGKVIPFAPKEDDPELLLTVGQMKELFDNLVFAEFTNEEALSIVAQIARK